MKSLVGRSTGKRKFERPKRRCGDNIKKSLKSGWYDVGLIG
jgi:hypothetical protein